MKYLQWELDLEDGLDPHDLLGKLVIHGDNGQLIEDCTFLDDFLAVFVDGLHQAKAGEIVAIDPIIEPNDVIFEIKDGELLISYGKQNVTIQNLDKFKLNLKEAIEELVILIDQMTLDLGEEKRKLAKLRNFIGFQEV
jgi:hypothetical protein